MQEDEILHVAKRPRLHDDTELFATCSATKLTDIPDTVVCYGTAVEVSCQALSGRSALLEQHPAILQDLDNNGDVELSLDLTGDRGIIGIGGVPKTAQLNKEAARALNEIAAIPGITFRAHLTKDTVEKLRDPQGNTQSKAPSRFTLDVNVFGPKLESEFVGEVLSRRHMYLQEPTWAAVEIEYHNPHVWKFDNIPEIDVWLAQLALDRPIGEQVAVQQGWSCVLDELSTSSIFQVDLDLSSLTVELLRHQTEALGFMTNRETGNLSEAMRYWKPGIDDKHTTTYRHVVTAAERKDCPREPSSGILADDMGLGKTLSTIALIVASSERANDFTRYGTSELVSHGTLTPTKATLVVVPSPLILDEWMKEIEKRTRPGTLRVTKYHGHERVLRSQDLLNFDLVLTTYGTITTEHRRSVRGGREVLYFLRWFRVVLDEAHTIRSPRTSQCKAILALHAVHHWCLTGTPISNKVEDLAPLLQFCRVPLLYDSSVFRDHVTKIARKSFRQGCNALRQVLSPVCLRRTKALLHLAQPRTIDHVVSFSAEEKEAYECLFRYSRHCLDAAVSGNTSGKAKHTILTAILHLRIFCNLGTFMPRYEYENDEAQLDPDEALTLLQEGDLAKCANCSAEVAVINQQHDLNSGVLGICTHVLCALCWNTAKDGQYESDQHGCPTCKEHFAEKSLHDEQQLPMSPSASCSTKLLMLTEELLAFQSKEKSIVFSVWRKTLDVASQLCDGVGIHYVRVDGIVPQAMRHQALDDFISNSNISTLLMTLGTGALGLNLTAATRVHILEPQWNPAVESQAIGRIVRLGQEKSVTVIRYTVKDSVEQQIQTYQRRKRQLVAAGFGDSAGHADYESKILTATFFTGGRELR